MSCDEERTSDGCQKPIMERLRYFTGRHMTARDFCDADAYHRTFRHLHNRILHGWGVACGLDVRPHPRPECRADRVLVRSGMAIDCCGREILVPKDEISGPIPWDQRPTSDDGCPNSNAVLILCLHYRETLTEMLPVLYSPEACSSPAMQEGRVREGYGLCWRWIRRDDLHRYGWRVSDPCAPHDASGGHIQGGYETSECGDHDGSWDEPKCCLDTACPPDHCVPLALIADRSEGEGGGPLDIETSGRRSLLQAREHLTHICWISWPHGGVVRAGDLDTLKVRFDRRLRVEPGCSDHPGPGGINAVTFVAEYGEIYEDMDFVPYRQPPYLDSDRRTAVFELADPRPSPSGGFRYLINHTVHVTLKCDFLLDCHNHAVDGDHLGGRLPSGDGVQGGTFESWFTVLSDDDYGQMMQQGAAMSGVKAAKE